MSAHGASRRPHRRESADLAQLLPGERVRYGRHLALPEFGIDSQRRLRDARVAVVGVGGLGSPAAMYLAAAGIGCIGLIDGDVVDASNLQRQVLYGDADVGVAKTEVASRRLSAMNGDIEVRTHGIYLDSRNALDVLREYDVVLDGTDNFPARYLINDATVLLGIPNVHGSVLRFEGRVSVFGSSGGPCYRCLFPEPPPPGVVQDCRDAGVLGVMPGLIGMLQATEVLKIVAGLGDSLVGRLLMVDGLGMRFHTVGLHRNPACPMCGTREITSLIDYDLFCGVEPTGDVELLSPETLARRLDGCAQLIDVREPWEWGICRLPGARLVPLSELDLRLNELDPGLQTVVYCHHGARSLEAARRLKAAGFGDVSHLEGGIDRWSAEVDASVARY